MENPEAEISHVIHLLTQSPPSTQLATIQRYFTPDAEIIHPFVRTGKWDQGNGWNSRWAISRIYRWYKILSPVIKLDVRSVAFDKENSILYVDIRQTFRIFAFALLGYKADVALVTKLSLEHRPSEGRYYIKEQNDLYQTDQFAKFLWFGLWRLVIVWHLISMVVCILLAAVGGPVSFVEEKLQVGEVKDLSDSWVDSGFNEREEERRRIGHANGRNGKR